MTSLTPDSVRSYLQEIGRYPLLTSEQEITLARLVQEMMAVEQQRQAMSTTGYAYAVQLNRQPTDLELATSLGQNHREDRDLWQRVDPANEQRANQ